ncbi:BatD family protein [Bradyrhizobium sp. CSS354]|uniref:BatD family protein n=1 Tax=Bradyrhizobium sp. CSS354 TaxID=2699172 RepID=UPI0023B0E51E|nr:BatD family protein [Bradyrhizobium sp. CSS354]MDE5460334.1 hypothetical protein [Bradyrhizobium sp. CSS354]
MRCWLAVFAVAIALPSQNALAQQAVGPEPVVKVTIDPPRVVVGQPATIHIVVLAPNYMTSPPELPGFQVRNAVTRQLQSVNTNEQRDGVAYAGVQFEYAIYPQEPGSYAVSGQKAHIKYAAEPPATREVDVTLPDVSFEAFIPDAAVELQPFLSAGKLTVEQEVKRSSDQLRAGDAVTRTVTIRAEGTPAMLLPPQSFATIDGLRLYPAQPSLEDRTDGRTDVMTSTRIDSATYMLERPGDYVLPAIDFGWWNVGSGKVETVHLDVVPLKVAVNPAALGTAPAGGSSRSWTWDGFVDFAAEHWPFALLAVLGIAALAWFGPGVVRRFADHHRRRRQANLQSEAFAFGRLRRAVRHRDARAAYFALLDWLPHLDAAPPDNTLGAFKAIARDPSLDLQLGVLEGELFGAQRDAGHWSPSQLWRGVAVARRSVRSRARVHTNTRLPQHLNPAAASSASAYVGRKPAR